MATLAVACVALGLAPFAVVPVLASSLAGLGGLTPTPVAFTLALPLGVTGPFGQMSAPLLALGLALLLALVPLALRVLGADRRLRVGDTWGCGRIGQTPRMEYTATAFAEPLRRVFAELYRPTRDLSIDFHPASKYFVQSIEYRSEIHPWFERVLYDPLLARPRHRGHVGAPPARGLGAPLPALHDAGAPGPAHRGEVVEMIGYVLEVTQAALALLLAPGLVGLIRWMKARLQNRRGAPVWQPYWELAKLFQKEVVVSRNASWLFRAAPFIVFASTVAVTFLVPILAVPLPFDAVGDLLVVVYLLLLGTFFLSLAGLDPGSPFGGMGASREMTVAALAEPTVALAIFALALSAGSTNLGQIAARTMADPGAAVSPGHLLAFGALFIVTLAETGRLPIDNPATHLELTMIHEAMVLEYSGRYLALIEWAAALKLLIFFSLLGNLFVPWGVSMALTPATLAVAVVSLLAKLVVLAGAVAVLETRIAKLRLFRVPELLSASFVLALLAVTSSFLLR